MLYYKSKISFQVVISKQKWFLLQHFLGREKTCPTLDENFISKKREVKMSLSFQTICKTKFGSLKIGGLPLACLVFTISSFLVRRGVLVFTVPTEAVSIKKLQAWELYYEETPTQVFSCEICEIFKSNFFTEHLRGLFLNKIKLKKMP